MATSFLKVLLVYMCITILLYAGGVRVLGDDSSNALGTFIDTDLYDNGTITASSGIEASLPSSFSESGSSLLSFIDSLGAIGSFILFIINIVFTPLGLFTSTGMPVIIQLLFGVPIMISLLLGVAYFIRSGGG